jgi:DNA polymerase III subunit delta
MKLTTRDIAGFMANPAPYAGVLVYGPDQGGVAQTARQLVDKILPDGDDGFNRTELTQEQLLEDEARLCDELCAMSLMGGRRFILLRDITDKVSGIIADAMAQAGKSVPPAEQHFMVITAGELSPKSSLRSLFEKEKHVAALPCYKEAGQSVAQLVRHKFDTAGIKYTSEIIAFLSAQLGGDRMVAESELEKILLFCRGDSQIEMDTLRQLTASSLDIELDAICHAFAGGNIPFLMQQLDSALLSGVQPIVILRAIDRLLTRIEALVLAMLEGKSSEQALASLRPPVFFKDKPRFQAYAKRWDRKRLAYAKHQLMRLDVHVKRHHEVDDLMLKDGLLRLAAMSGSKAAA